MSIRVDMWLVIKFLDFGDINAGKGKLIFLLNHSSLMTFLFFSSVSFDPSFTKGGGGGGGHLQRFFSITFEQNKLETQNVA